MLIIWTLYISVPVIIILFFFLINKLASYRKKKNADHMDFECSSSCHTYSSLQINKLALMVYNPFYKHQPQEAVLIFGLAISGGPQLEGLPAWLGDPFISVFPGLSWF